MGLSASQGRMLLLTARQSDLEFRAQQISQKRLVLSQQLEEISTEYESSTSNRQMKISLSLQNAASESDVVSKTSNLTYATLVSGTVCNPSLSSQQTGLRSYERTEGQEYVSNAPYRLVDANGAIVVSDLNEIPNMNIVKVSKKAEKNNNGIYTTGTKDIEGTWTKSTNYISLEQFEPDSPLMQYLNSDEGKKLLEGNQSFQIDMERGIIQIGEEYFFISGDNAGQKALDSDNYECNDNIKIAENASKIPEYYQEVQSDNNLLKKGNDGKYRLYDSENNLINTYILDSTLKYGKTDVNGAIDGPNYLQDCLRNGKYLIQKGCVNTETNALEWHSLSWDATANISDSYYTEDDDRAKAKYDRMQTQIQNQDKKLELELDNIETQRKAVTTEEESVKKVIDENIEGSFNAFA